MSVPRRPRRALPKRRGRPGTTRGSRRRRRRSPDTAMAC